MRARRSLARSSCDEPASAPCGLVATSPQGALAGSSLRWLDTEAGVVAGVRLVSGVGVVVGVVLVVESGWILE